MPFSHSTSHPSIRRTIILIVTAGLVLAGMSVTSLNAGLLKSLTWASPAQAQEDFDFGEGGNAAMTDEEAAAIGDQVDVSKTCDTKDKSKPCLTSDSTVFMPLGNLSVAEIIGKVISSIIGLIGVIALVMFIYGGLTMMLAGGNTDKVTKAKNTLIWATLGLIMVFGAYAIVDFVIATLTT